MFITIQLTVSLIVKLLLFAGFIGLYNFSNGKNFNSINSVIASLSETGVPVFFEVQLPSFNSYSLLNSGYHENIKLLLFDIQLLISSCDI